MCQTHMVEKKNFKKNYILNSLLVLLRRHTPFCMKLLLKYIYIYIYILFKKKIQQNKGGQQRSTLR